MNDNDKKAVLFIFKTFAFIILMITSTVLFKTDKISEGEMLITLSILIGFYLRY